MRSISKDSLRALVSTATLSELEAALSEDQEPKSDDTIQELLATAARESRLDVVNLFLAKYPSVPLDEKIVRITVSEGSVPIMKALLAREPSAINMPFDHYGSPLIVACMRRKSAEFLQYLLEFGADPNQDPDAATFPLAIVAALYKDPTVIDMLLQHGANLEGSGALGASARLGNQVMMRHLLKRGARPESDATCPTYGGSPLYTAVEAGHVGVAKILLQHGADLRAEDAKGMTPIDIAKKMEQEGKDMSHI
ncbi:hypothetical protein ACLX1H_005446 [Fusarium chlamydosporum]